MSTIKSQWAVLLLAVSAGFLFFHSPGTGDVKAWLGWVYQARPVGFIKGYTLVRSEYPPFAIAVLNIADRVASYFVPTELSAFLGLKASLLLFWLSSIGIYFHFYLKRNQWHWALALFPFGLLLNSMGLGYLDIYAIPLFLLSIFYIHKAESGTSNRTWILGVTLYCIAILMKWQPFLFFPFLAIYLYRRKVHLIALSTSAILFVGLIAVYRQEPLLAFYRVTRHISLSAQAFNLNGIFQWILLQTADHANFTKVVPDTSGDGFLIYGPGLKITIFCKFLFAVHYLICLWSYLIRGRTLEDFLSYSLIGYLSYVTFNTGVHENHLIWTFPLVALLFYLEVKNAGLFFIFGMLANLNMLVFYGLTGAGIGVSRKFGNFDLLLVFCAVEVVLYYWLFLPKVFPIRFSIKKLKMALETNFSPSPI